LESGIVTKFLVYYLRQGKKMDWDKFKGAAVNSLTFKTARGIKNQLF